MMDIFRSRRLAQVHEDLQFISVGAVYALFIPAIHISINEQTTATSWAATYPPLSHINTPPARQHPGHEYNSLGKRGCM